MNYQIHAQQNLAESCFWSWPDGAIGRLLLWRNWQSTGIVFCLIIILLLDITVNSIISVVSVLGVLGLLLSLGYCSYVWTIRKLNKSSNEEHPMRRYMEMDLSISEQTAECLARLLVQQLNPIIQSLRALFLVEDLVDTLKLLLLFCVLNILGDYVTGMNLLLIGFVLLFTLPKLYDCNKSFFNLQLQQLLLYKRLLMGDSVNPADNEQPLNQTYCQFNAAAYNETGEQDEYSSDCAWPIEQQQLLLQQDTPSEGYHQSHPHQHFKQL
ncbi:Rtnl2 [Drosophila busckii]|uniref:Reticulon-like protein n=1 Tax=Drosophila busckii TaxID=30019 RepID=A0A0M4EZY3_DROBS|nr:Rtnl2 [Drosophila busckii]